MRGQPTGKSRILLAKAENVRTGVQDMHVPTSLEDVVMDCSSGGLSSSCHLLAAPWWLGGYTPVQSEGEQRRGRRKTTTDMLMLAAFTRSTIRLQDHRAFGGSSGALSTLASVPYFLLGVASVGVAWISERIPFLQGLFASRSNYRQVPVDDDGEICFSSLLDVHSG